MYQKTTLKTLIEIINIRVKGEKKMSELKNKDLAELEKIKYTAKSLKQGVISKELADLLIDRANEMYEVDKI